MHAKGLLHLDIQPSKIILDAQGSPTLVGFSAAQAALASRQQSITVIHTPGYAAIEQLSDGQTGPATDVYGLAATLYQCVTGAAPVPAIKRLAERLAPAAQQAAGRYPYGLLAAIDAGLAFRLSDRPASIAAWRASLDGREPGPDETAAPATPDTTTALPVMALPPRPQPAVQPAATVSTGERHRSILTRLVSRARRNQAAMTFAGLAMLAIALGLAGGYVLRSANDQAARAAVERRAAAEAAREQAAAEARRLAAEAEAEAAAARQRAEAAARQEAEAAERAAAGRRRSEAATRLTVEAAVQARADAEARRQQEAEAMRLAAEEKARTDAAAGQSADATAPATAGQTTRSAADEAARLAAEDAQAEAAVRQAVEDAARAEQAAERRAEDARRAAEQKAREEAAAKARAEAAARQKADAEAKRRAEAEKAKVVTPADRRQAEITERGLGLSPRDRRRTQVALTALGFDTNGIDEEFGNRTRQMIAQWQKRQGAPNTGFLTAPQVALLQRQASAALATYDADETRINQKRRRTELADTTPGPAARTTGNDRQPQAAASSSTTGSEAPSPATTASSADTRLQAVAAATTRGNAPDAAASPTEEYTGSARTALNGGENHDKIVDYTLTLRVAGQIVSGVMIRHCPTCGADGNGEHRSFACDRAPLRPDRTFSLRCDGAHAWGTLDRAKVHYANSGIELLLTRVRGGG